MHGFISSKIICSDLEGHSVCIKKLTPFCLQIDDIGLVLQLSLGYVLCQVFGKYYWDQYYCG